MSKRNCPERFPSPGWDGGVHAAICSLISVLFVLGQWLDYIPQALLQLRSALSPSSALVPRKDRQANRTAWASLRSPLCLSSHPKGPRDAMVSQPLLCTPNAGISSSRPHNSSTEGNRGTEQSSVTGMCLMSVWGVGCSPVSAIAH